MTEQPAPDWEAFIRRHAASGVAELDLRTIKPGDTLLVLTRHTAYTFAMLGHEEAMLTTSRADRPSGRVRINGCTFGASSTIKPKHLFCGGSVEFVHGEKQLIFTTTEIRALQLTQADQAQG